MNICTTEVAAENTDEESKMLCNVLVRATQELHNKQQQTRDEIQVYLKNDCQTLKAAELAEKVCFEENIKFNCSFFSAKI